MNTFKLDRCAAMLRLMLCAAALFILGCQSAPEARIYGGRSYAFDSPTMQTLAAQQATSHDAGVPWYAGRRDIRPSVQQGVAASIVEQTVTQTTDIQRSYRGRVNNQISVRQYRTQVRRVVR